MKQCHHLEESPREKPRASSLPSAATTTAPTENALGDGGHRRASDTARAIQCASSPGSADSLAACMCTG